MEQNYRKWLEEAAARAATRFLEVARAKDSAGGERSFYKPVRGAGGPTTLDSRKHRLVKGLFEEAFQSGFARVPDFDETYDAPDAGSTAAAVLKAQIAVEFYVKLDDKPKLAAEAANLRRIQARRDLPDELKACFPRVFAAKSDGELNGYVMESFKGFTGFEKICFAGNHKQADIMRVGEHVLKLLFAAYDRSKNPLVRPNLQELYLGRITERLNAVAQKDAEFRTLVAGVIHHGGDTFEPPAAYLDRIAPRLHDIDCGFTTFVHGDPHPENILARLSPSSVEVRFIDPKEWSQADYIFDVGKLLHYLQVTGPAEKLPVQPRASFNQQEARVDYRLSEVHAVREFVAHVEQRVESFAMSVGDRTWKERLSLSMASNLLGLPLGRLASRRHSALITYVEGLRWLKRTADLIDGGAAV